MEIQQLKVLRRNKYIIVNIIMSLFLTLYCVLLYKRIPPNLLFIGLGLFLLVQLVLSAFNIIAFPFLYYLFPSMKKLYFYEKEKLGDRWRKTNRNYQFSNLLMVFILFFHGNYWKVNLALDSMYIKVILVIIIVIFLILNISLCVHSMNTDRGSA